MNEENSIPSVGRNKQEKAASTADRIRAHEKSLMDRLNALFGEE